jgi:signal transduction histidine kinase
MDRMTTTEYIRVTRRLWALRANWPALVLPLVAVDALGLTRGKWPVLLVIVAMILVMVAPKEGAKIAPFALIAYGAYGIFLMHSLLVFERSSAFYGFVHATRGTYPEFHTSGPMWLVLTEAVAFLAAGVWLLARPGALGGGPVRRAIAQVRGTGGQPKTVPPLLLIPVIFLWEELFSQELWFGPPGARGLVLIAVLLFAFGVGAVVWLPRAAATIAVAGTVLLGLSGVAWGTQWLWHPGYSLAGLLNGYVSGFYGAVPLDGVVTRLFSVVQGVALLGVGCVLAPRLLTWGADFELAERARVLAQRVEGLTRTRSDATDTAVAELRRIERDLHDGAQARMVAVGMSLRAAEQMMGSNPAAALALVVEARETSSRAIADLRDLVRGIYPPVLADRGLAAAVRNLAFDAVLVVDVNVDLPAEPPMPVAAAVYFAVAESLNNAALHAEASRVQINMAHDAGILRVRVTDDGRGGAAAALGTGLAGVERRLATFDGIIAVNSPVGGPTIVAIEVPCALSSVKTSSC